MSSLDSFPQPIDPTLANTVSLLYMGGYLKVFCARNYKKVASLYGKKYILLMT